MTRSNEASKEEGRIVMEATEEARKRGKTQEQEENAWKDKVEKLAQYSNRKTDRPSLSPPQWPPLTKITGQVGLSWESSKAPLPTRSIPQT